MKIKKTSEEILTEAILVENEIKNKSRTFVQSKDKATILFEQLSSDYEKDEIEEIINKLSEINNKEPEEDYNDEYTEYL